MLHAVILAGGGGTRLWPLSRAHYLKQFLKLFGEHTLLQQTVLRSRALIPPERFWVVTGKEQESIARSQLAALPEFGTDAGKILVEPVGKNTVAAIGLAAVHLLRHDPAAVMAVMPADHWIARPNVFVALLQQAAQLAQDGVLVTLGIIPDRPETGYGYIRRDAQFFGPPSPAGERVAAYRVARFVEKPTVQKVQEYLDSVPIIGTGAFFSGRRRRLSRKSQPICLHSRRGCGRSPRASPAMPARRRWKRCTIGSSRSPSTTESSRSPHASSYCRQTSGGLT